MQTLSPELRSMIADLALLLVSIVLPVLAVYLRRGYLRIAELAGVALTQETRAALDWAIDRGVAYAEERARTALAAGGLVSSDDKHEDAAATVRALVPRAASKVGADELSRLIDARVAALRASLSPPPAVG